MRFDVLAEVVGSELRAGKGRVGEEGCGTLCTRPSPVTRLHVEPRVVERKPWKAIQHLLWYEVGPK